MCPETRECKLEGYAICKVKLGLGRVKVAKVYIEIPATYTSDWQEDGGFWHDEGNYDYDESNASPVDREEFSLVNTTGFEENKNSKIEKILEIFASDLSEAA